VLVGNHTEDRFGAELNDAPSVKWTQPKSEMRSQHNMVNTMSGYGRENHATKPKTEDEIIDDKAFKEFSNSISKIFF
jgi:hypothetical protein